MNNDSRLKSKSITIEEFIFYFALFLYCAYVMLANTVWIYEAEDTILMIRKVLRYSIFFLICLDILYINEYTPFRLSIYIVLFGIALLEWKQIDYSGLFLQFGLILCAGNKDFKKIVNYLMVLILLWLVFVHGLCFFGVIEDYTYTHTLGSYSQTAHSLGFKAYNHLGFMAMAISLMFIYVKKPGFLCLLMLLIVNYLYYKIHTTRLSLLIVFAGAFLYVISFHLRMIKFSWKGWTKVFTILPLLMFLMVFFLVYMYDKGKLKISLSFMSTLESRLKYSVYFYKTYGIKILGQHIEMNTISDKHYNGADNNVYLDSGYVYSLIVYGLVLTLIILIMYTLISRHIIKKGDVVLIVWFIVMLGAIVVNNFILNLIFNPLLFLFPKAINDFISGSSNGIYEEI